MDQLIARVREILSATPGYWRALAGSVEPSLLARRPAPGEWSADECLHHLLDTGARRLLREAGGVHGRP